MADALRFIQFPHPGREHSPDASGGRVWNTYDSPHGRMFMEFPGQWVDGVGGERRGPLRAWAEWEAEANLIRELGQPYQDPSYPRYLWRPYYVPKRRYKRLHNTDPFIFGDRLLYSNCKQQSGDRVTALAGLARGTVLAFGSGMKMGGERKWALDTVIVVADSIPYSSRRARSALAGVAPEAFLVVTGEPIAANDRASFRLYRGATPEGPVAGMFSFFPAMLAHGGAGFPRPVIDLPREHFNPGSWQAPKGLRRELPVEELRTLWGSLVAQTRAAELVLGTRAGLPEQREPSL